MSSTNTDISRRRFLARTGQIAAGVFATGTLASCTTAQKPAYSPAARCFGANERINMAVIGVRSRGNALAEGFAAIPNVRVKTICDIDENLFAKRVKKLEEIQGTAPGTENDLRRIFDDKNIDAIAIGAPNHWHALATIWGCQAGKHIYVEKPCCHNQWEGRKMIEAARKYDRLVAVGFQSRSNGDIRSAIKFVKEGGLGEVYMARGLCYKPRESLGKCPDGYGDGDYKYYIHGERGPVHDSSYFAKVNYDLWLGPAPVRPFNYNRFHYNWHWHWDYGNGDIGNNGPHEFDKARWGLNKNEHPVKISSSGGCFGFKNNAQETANTQVATFEYADGKILQFEVRGLYTNSEKEIKIGNFFYGSEGWMVLKGGRWSTYFGRKNEPGPSSESTEPESDPMNFAGNGADAHYGNFVKALRSGKRTDLNSEIESGYMSSVLPSFANISYRLGENLVFDGKKEKFVGNSKANEMLTRKYRKPYVVPERV